MRDNIIVASDWHGEHCRTAPVWQGDYGIILQLEGVELPPVFETHFTDVSQGPAVAAVGADGAVAIPDTLLQGTKDGLNISFDLLRALVILDRAGVFDGVG